MPRFISETTERRGGAAVHRILTVSTVATLSVTALVVAELPWSELAALPSAAVCMLPIAFGVSLIVDLVFWAARRSGQQFDRSLGRLLKPALAMVLGAALLLAGAVAANLVFIDEPLEGTTLLGYAASAVMACALVAFLLRSARFARWMDGSQWHRTLQLAPLTCGMALSAIDAIAFPSYYDSVHRLLAILALTSLAIGLRAALHRACSTPASLAIFGSISAALALAGLGSMLDEGTRTRSVRAAVSHPTVHRRAVAWARDMGDGDGDGFSPWLGGGDCDDEDSTAFPFALDGDPCVELVTSPRAAAARHADEADAQPSPRVLVLVTIDAFRCGFGGLAAERNELRDACPELSQLGETGLLRPDAHAVWPATARSLAAIHRTQRGRLADALGDLGYYRIMVPGTALSLVVGDQDSRGHYDTIIDAAHLGSASGRATSAHRVTATVLDALHSATVEHERVFLWAHYYDPHAPYVSDASQNLVLEPDLIRYVSEVQRTDAAIGELARGLRADPALSDAVMLVTADHSEGFGEHGDVRHGTSLYETNVRIPMLAWRAGEHSRRGLPSMLPAGSDQVGDYLLAVAAGRPFEARDETIMRVTSTANEQWGIASEGWKLIYHRSLGYVELFDLQGDPYERSDLAQDHPDETRRLLTLLYQDACR